MKEDADRIMRAAPSAKSLAEALKKAPSRPTGGTVGARQLWRGSAHGDSGRRTAHGQRGQQERCAIDEQIALSVTVAGPESSLPSPTSCAKA